MSLLGNILWIILGGGIILFFEYLLAGLLLCLTVIGIPFGALFIKLSFLALAPFSKETRQLEKASGCLSTLMNLIWILIGGTRVMGSSLHSWCFGDRQCAGSDQMDRWRSYMPPVIISTSPAMFTA